MYVDVHEITEDNRMYFSPDVPQNVNDMAGVCVCVRECLPVSGCVQVCPRMLVLRRRSRWECGTGYPCQSQQGQHTQRETQGWRRTETCWTVHPYMTDPVKK